MSNTSDSGNTANSENAKESNFTIIKLESLKEFDHEQLCQYVQKLQTVYLKCNKKLQQFRNRVKFLEKTVQLLNDEKRRESGASEENKNFLNITGDGEQEKKDASSPNAALDFVAEIRKAADEAQHLNGFVYEPTSGLYYDHKTGYYYNAECGLYYDGNTGCYYTYNQEKSTFEFHSQVPVLPNKIISKKSLIKIGDDKLTNYDTDVEYDEFGVIMNAKKYQQIKAERKKQKKGEEKRRRKLKKKKRKSKKEKKKRKRQHKSKNVNNTETDNEPKTKIRKICDFEDGELSPSTTTSGRSSKTSNSDDSDSQDKLESTELITDGILQFEKGSHFQDIAKNYPPSLRLIVKETNLKDLKIGSLYVVTYKGGGLGREGNHDIIIPDVNVSKSHLKFDYDTEQQSYYCIDLGSQNGTLLNGVRMSSPKSESSSQILKHGSIIQIGLTKLLCHVHEGNTTCGLCEPGLLMNIAPEASTEIVVQLSHREQLRKLQRKYGLENEKFVDVQKTDSSYNDRAAARRTQVGSSTDNEKTQTACVNTEISSENKGFKMLANMGWNKGEALGKTNAASGLLEPINVASNEGTKGLGCDITIGMSPAINKKKLSALKKTQERYQKADMFCISDESD